MYLQIAAVLSGVLFGLGLVISQMIDADKVISFLNITGNWDPSLALVLLSAVAVSTIGFAAVNKRVKPLFADVFQLPNRSDIDVRLISGAAIFGLGWGLVGYCPGPAIAALTTGSLQPLIFVGAMLVGSWTVNAIDRRGLFGEN